MIEAIEVSETLMVEIVHDGRKPVVRIARERRGLVAVWPSELRSLIVALTEAAGVLAEAAAARASEHTIVEARRLRRRRVDGSG